MNKEKVTETSIGLGGLIFIVFLILKLVDFNKVSDWSWWWVTSPLWVPLVVVLGIFGIIVIFWMLATIFTKLNNKHK